MSAEAQEEAVRPVIIIKRVDDDHDDHHGGVWKIAFADFMTAMMAFFLVMWLINAANEETKAQVASYFNPVKLTDAVLAPKGVKSMDATSPVELPSEEAEAQGNGPSDDNNTKASKSGTKAADTVGKTDAALFQDPYQTLNNIAGEIGSGPSAEDAVKLSRDKSGSKDSDVFRDPFDPEYRSKISLDSPKDKQATADKKENDTAQEKEKKTALKEVLPIVDESAQSAETPAQVAQKLAQLEIQKLNTIQSVKIRPDRPEKMETAKLETEEEKTDGAVKMPQEKTDKKVGETQKAKKDQSDTPKDATDVKDPAGTETKIAKNRTELKGKERLNELKQQLKKVTEKSQDKKLPNLTVEQTDAGLLVSLTDTFGFEMFSTSSAKPTAALIKLIDRISPILRNQKGRLVVRGHTDGRPFKSKTYDNWRLSTARAHMARHMLIRGGIESDRIIRIEGHADRHLKNKEKPFAAENRRIEVLIVDEKV